MHAPFKRRQGRAYDLRVDRKGGGEIGRLYRLGIHLSHGQALQLGDRSIWSLPDQTPLAPLTQFGCISI
jgi:hypothetical protein